MSLPNGPLPVAVESEDRPLKRQRHSHSGQPLQCHVCARTYERADHLNRHLDSRE